MITYVSISTHKKKHANIRNEGLPSASTQMHRPAHTHTRTSNVHTRMVLIVVDTRIVVSVAVKGEKLNASDVTV